jgi:hypothetical protein
MTLRKLASGAALLAGLAGATERVPYVLIVIMMTLLTEESSS